MSVSDSKTVVENYFTSKGTVYGQFLDEDVELTEWAPGVPPSGARTRGKAALLQNRGSREYKA